MSENTQAVTKVQPQQQQPQPKREITKASKVRNLLGSDSVRAQIEKALPKICSAERFMRIAMTAITKNPKIAECTEASLMGSLLDLATLGIEADGRRAHLIPYGTTCTLIIDYKGLVELVRRSGDVLKLHADVICDNDIFEYDCGEVTKHVINFKGDRGNIYAVYATATMKDGSKQCEVMTAADVEKIRSGSMGKNSSPWKNHWGEMAKKTVFRRLCKWLPLSSETLELVSKDDKQFYKPQMEINLPDGDVIEG